MRTTTWTSPVTKILTTALAVAVAVLLSAAPAAAHDELVATDPATGETVAALPAELTLSFSADLLTDEGASVVEVTDSSGADLTDGDPAVEGATVVQSLSAAAQGEVDGTVTVLWRVVSSDGHPISGEYSFTVATPASPTPTETTAPSPTTSETAKASPSASASASPTPAPAEDSSIAAWIIVSVLVAVAVAATIVVVVSRRTARTHER